MLYLCAYIPYYQAVRSLRLLESVVGGVRMYYKFPPTRKEFSLFNTPRNHFRLLLCFISHTHGYYFQRIGWLLRHTFTGVETGNFITWHSIGHRAVCCGQSWSRSFGSANRSRGSFSRAIGRSVLASVFTSSWFVFRLLAKKLPRNPRRVAWARELKSDLTQWCTHKDMAKEEGLFEFNFYHS